MAASTGSGILPLFLLVICVVIMSDNGISIPFPLPTFSSPLSNASTCPIDESRSLIVSFDGPAKHWTDATPIGNGRLGAMVWGQVPSELLQLNEDTLWTGTPGEYTDPAASDALLEVRNLVYDGQYANATIVAEKLSGNPPDVYQLLGDFRIDFGDSHALYSADTYVRELDLNTAMVRVKYSVGGVEFTREYFASNPDQAIVMKFFSSKPRYLTFVVSLDSKLQHQTYINGRKQIVMEGKCPGKRIPPKGDESDHPEGIQFAAILDILTSEGNAMAQVLDGGKLKIEGTDWAVVRLVASSTFDGPFTNPENSKKDPVSHCIGAIVSMEGYSYSDLYTRHLGDYKSLFHRVSLKLSRSSNRLSTDGIMNTEDTKDLSCLKNGENHMVSTSSRVKYFQTDEDPSLLELLFQFGRYLLISCSRPGSQVANLQGIWNKDIQPAWDCAPHLNINLQMNYWPSLSANLLECQQPLFDYMDSLSKNGAKTAKINYKANGWVVHQVSDIWAKTSPDKGQAVWALWQMGGTWLCTHLWEHYTYTLDKDFLSLKAYPLLEGCASFLLDWLIEGKSVYLETNPSTSPEHMFVEPDSRLASVSFSTTMDIAIIKEIFNAIVSAAEVLGKRDNELVKKVQQAQQKLRPTKIALDGTIMEWVLEFEDPDVKHRHLSHLFGLFPGHTITIENTPELSKAAEISLIKRGVDGPGWSTTWKIALWAHLRNSGQAYRMVKHLMVLVDPDHESSFEGGLYSNLFAAHPPFQIDANFGFTAAISEMLVQSSIGDIHLLPALPREKWPSGCVKGLRARGGVTVSVCWEEGNLLEVTIHSVDHTSIINLHYRGKTVKAKLEKGLVYSFNEELVYIKI